MRSAGTRGRPGPDPVRGRDRRRYPRPAVHPGRLLRHLQRSRGRPADPTAAPGPVAGRPGRRAPAGEHRRGAGVQPAQRAHRDGYRPGRRGRDTRRRPGRAAGADVHPERGQGRGHRLRAGGQGTGDRDGDPAATDGLTAPAGRRGGRAGARHLPHLARGNALAPGGGRGFAPAGGRMIASVRGRVASVAPDGAVVELGVVGLAVQCTPGTLAGLRVGTEARLATSLVVREDSLTLYGFADEDEKQLFELLQTASGVGPRLAQAVLAVLTPDAVRKAVAAGDTATLTRVPGIGKKGAERLVLELRDRIGPVVVTVPGQPVGVAGSWPEQVRQALVGLGWTVGQADQAVAAVAETVDGGVPPVPVLLKQAIRLLGQSR